MGKVKKTAPVSPTSQLPGVSVRFADPGPGCKLTDVPNMPPEAVPLFAARGVHALGDLRPLVEAAAAADPQCEPVFVICTQMDLPTLIRYKAGAAFIDVMGGRVHMLKVMSAWPLATVPAAPIDNTFDESTPPPRSRPHGAPLQNYIVLPPGEEFVGIFRQWDREGRTAAGSILCEFIGVWHRRDSTSGYRLLADSVAGRRLCAIGAELSCEAIDPFRVAHVIVRPGTANWFAILSPTKGRTS